MKMFWVITQTTSKYRKLLTLLGFLAFFSCASQEIQKEKLLSEKNFHDTIVQKKSHTFFLVGDAGNSENPETQKLMSVLENELKQHQKNSTLLFLGDQIYPKGMPANKNDKSRNVAENKLLIQLKAAKKFNGKTIFIPGNHDWYHGLDGLKEQQNFVTKYLNDKKSFLPKNGCALETVKINDDIALIIIDSEWYLQDWDKHPKMNDDCSIRTRLEFLNTLKSEINKNQNKLTLLVMHHPLITNGPHGGVFSFQKNLYPINNQIPLPVLGSFINLLRKTSGASPQDLQNKIYSELINHIKPMIQNRNNVLIVSGHEHNLQYIEYEGLKQLISGSASKKEAAKTIGPNDFSLGSYGFCKLVVYEDKSFKISFYQTNKDSDFLVQDINIPSFEAQKQWDSFVENNESKVQVSVYDPKMTKKSKLYQFLWGKHYRDYYGLEIQAPTVKLDTLYGGLTPTISGGGNQSESVRLIDKNGKDFVMRGLKKNAPRFFQSIFRDQNAVVNFQNTYAEKFIYDFYTSTHPFMPLVIGDLSDAVGVFHSNPKLFYVPKQEPLGIFNHSFGDKLYLIEERQTSRHLDLESYGKPNNILGTDEVLDLIRKNEKHLVDETSYLKARLFDMLIGDWDRHSDQWKWAEFEENNQKIYKPIPRDRDQAFAKVDGHLMSLLLNIPGVRHITNFKTDFPSVKWFNFSAHSLDVAFLKNATEEDWKKLVAELKSQLTDDVIDKAFLKLPNEIRSDETTLSIKNALKSRKNKLEEFALSYYRLLQEKIIVVGTDKKDLFEMEYLENGAVDFKHYRIKKEQNELQFERIYQPKETKEIWVYGLDDDDIFNVKGVFSSQIKIRLIGGQNHDVYQVNTQNTVHIYDYESKKNTLDVVKNTKLHLNDNYELNEYHFKKPKYSHGFFLPLLGFNPDDGIKTGGTYSFVKQGFVNDPFTAKHQMSAFYYFATEGVEFKYQTIFNKLIGRWDFTSNIRYTTPNFSINYFGFGNETKNMDRDRGMNYNRVRIQVLEIAPSIKFQGRMGSEIEFQTKFENIEVEETSNRFINEPNTINTEVFEYQQFASTSFSYAFKNYDNESNPSLGMNFLFKTSWTLNLSNSKRNFGYFESHLGFSHKLVPSKKLVLGTILKGKILTNNHFEFYQGATLGGDYDLRGFRNERFLGRQSFFQSTDLRWNIGKIKSLIPMQYGILAGYDYGRVWLDGENSNRWHQSFGGGIWLNGLDLVTARLTFFNSQDGNRIAFGLGFGF
jgi:hypothetical protein